MFFNEGKLVSTLMTELESKLVEWRNDAMVTFLPGDSRMGSEVDWFKFVLHFVLSGNKAGERTYPYRFTFNYGCVAIASTQLHSLPSSELGVRPRLTQRDKGSHAICTWWLALCPSGRDTASAPVPL
jgi:hypothetical protein